MGVINFVNENAPYVSAENLNEIQKSNIYSTNEIKIGQWIDGKPIYRKTIYVGEIDCSSAGFKYVQHGVSNVDIPIKIDYILNAKSNQPAVYNNVITALALEKASDGVSSNIRFYVGAWDKIKDWYFIFEYTKTTD